MEAPTYTRLKNNCYWYVATIFDAIAAHFGVDTSTTRGDTLRERRYTLLEPNMPGRWMGLKITTSDPEEISAIISKYKKAHTNLISKVMTYMFLPNHCLLLHSEQITAPSRLLVAAKRYSETVG